MQKDHHAWITIESSGGDPHLHVNVKCKKTTYISNQHSSIVTILQLKIQVWVPTTSINQHSGMMTFLHWKHSGAGSNLPNS